MENVSRMKEINFTFEPSKPKYNYQGQGEVWIKF